MAELWRDQVRTLPSLTPAALQEVCDQVFLTTACPFAHEQGPQGRLDGSSFTSRGGAALPLSSPTEKPELLLSQPRLIALPSNLAPKHLPASWHAGNTAAEKQVGGARTQGPEHRGLPTGVNWCLCPPLSLGQPPIQSEMVTG